MARNKQSSPNGGLKKMKKFSKSWASSKKPSKQRKYRLNAPLNIKRKFLSVHLSKELKLKYKTGMIIKVITKKAKVFIEGIENNKKDGTKTYYPIEPSNIMITELNLTDKR